MKRSMLATIALCGLLVGFAATPANASGFPPSTTVDGCAAAVSGPTKSTTTPATLSISASVQCSGPVSSITLNLVIFNYRLPISFSGATVANAAGLTGTDSVVCVSGNDYGTAGFQITFPGSPPQTIGIVVDTPDVPIKC